MTFAKKLLTTSIVAGGVLGALTVFNKMTASMAGELDTVLTGEERRYPWKDGDMFYEVKGSREAKPLLLIHSFGPGASSYEWRKNIDALAEQFRVYAIDLLGFGLSDRPSIDYTTETYTDLINDFIKEVIGKPTIVVAHGLTCAYVIANAYRRPQLFERLVLVSPPPTMLQESYPGPVDSAWKFVLRLPVIGEFAYNLLNSRQSIRNYYDQQGYHNPGLISDDLVEYVFTSAHQENSRYPIASFLSNNLALDVHEPLARLQMPILALWGREGMLTPSEASAAFKRVNPRVEVRIIDKGSFHVQEEQAANFNSAVREFAAATVTK
ncbi:alpha/beta fold hydrolase [Ktedonosporobacter rubrisoli]|uniref:Alpha/beta fold hydrolase n=1 Tax=Ktedonosporobacter rubrisoli TaxID=2509675 RepID=A0A4P6JZU9_KTERU|nr:alpha/beta fold hydrolase [Ktedonosporobacter rubrisoli]QBD81043.1 alpha/beta fold hydrolase [Ktedonosporobacter rubrisoli]